MDRFGFNLGDRLIFLEIIGGGETLLPLPSGCYVRSCRVKDILRFDRVRDIGRSGSVKDVRRGCRVKWTTATAGASPDRATGAGLSAGLSSGVTSAVQGVGGGAAIMGLLEWVKSSVVGRINGIYWEGNGHFDTKVSSLYACR